MTQTPDDGYPPPIDLPVGQRLGSERLFDEYFPPPEQMTPDPPLEKIPTKRHPRRKKPKPPLQPPVAPAESRLGAKQGTPKWAGFVSNGLEIAGIGAITAGSWLITAWLGLIVLGVCLILLGIALGLPRTRE